MRHTACDRPGAGSRVVDFRDITDPCRCTVATSKQHTTILQSDRHVRLTGTVQIARIRPGPSSRIEDFRRSQISATDRKAMSSPGNQYPTVVQFGERRPAARCVEIARV